MTRHINETKNPSGFRQMLSGQDFSSLTPPLAEMSDMKEKFPPDL